MSVTHVHTVEMGCQMVQLLSAHIVGVNLTSALGLSIPLSFIDKYILASVDSTIY